MEILGNEVKKKKKKIVWDKRTEDRGTVVASHRVQPAAGCQLPSHHIMVVRRAVHTAIPTLS